MPLVPQNGNNATCLTITNGHLDQTSCDPTQASGLEVRFGDFIFFTGHLLLSLSALHFQCLFGCLSTFGEYDFFRIGGNVLLPLM